MASRSGSYVWSLGRTLNDNQSSCVFKTSLPCCRSDQSSTLHRISFFCKNVFFAIYIYVIGSEDVLLNSGV